MTHKKYTILFLFTLILLASCGLKANGVKVIRRVKNNTDTSLARVIVGGKLTIGVQILPPYCMMDEAGVFSGFDIEVAREVARILNVEIEFIPITYTQIKNGIESEPIDCLWGGFDSSDFITGPFIFSDDYIRSTLVLATATDSRINSVEEARDKKIAMLCMAESLPAAGVVQTILNDFENLSLAHELDYCIDDLLENKLDGIVTDIFTATYFKAKDTVSDTIDFGQFIEQSSTMKALSADGRLHSFSLKTFNQPIRRRSYNVIFSQSDVALRDRINEALELLEYNAVLENLSRRWFGSDIIVFGK